MKVNSEGNVYRRFAAGFFALVVVAGACSQPAENADGSGSTSAGVEQAESETTMPETTMPASLTGLELELDGSPPSTTVSDDEVEQTAAEVVHWQFETLFSCLEVAPNCDFTDFRKTTSGGFLAQQESYDQVKAVEPGARQAESRVFWSRKSPDNPENVVVVLACNRNYYVYLDANGDVYDDTSPIYLELYRVERGEDGNFRMSAFLIIDSYQPESEGGDLCSEYDGIEVPANRIEQLY